MTKEDIHTRYDTLLAGLLFTVSVLGVIMAAFGDPSLLKVWLQVVSGIGMACLVGYLLLATLFLDACSNGDDTKANRLQIAAKCFQWASMLISLVVIILLTII